MKKQDNICKFITESTADKLSTYNFVFEKNFVDKERVFEKNAVYLVASGEGELITDGIKAPVKMGDIFFVFRQHKTRIVNKKDLTYMYITFSGERGEELLLRFGITPANNVFQGHESLFAFWQNAIIKANEKNLDLISESVLLYTFGEMTQAEESSEQHLVNAVIKLVDEGFSDNTLNLEAVSKKLGYNSKYVSRVFKNAMGTTFSSYLTNIRVQNAVFLFEQGVTSIKNVAVLSGYSDPFYFSNVFKGVTGVSPRDYLKK
jgi:YesN/AraC family two-component response regulator